MSRVFKSAFTGRDVAEAASSEKRSSLQIFNKIGTVHKVPSNNALLPRLRFCTKDLTLGYFTASYDGILSGLNTGEKIRAIDPTGRGTAHQSLKNLYIIAYSVILCARR
jgi:hypothetical protein